MNTEILIVDDNTDIRNIINELKILLILEILLMN